MSCVCKCTRLLVRAVWCSFVLFFCACSPGTNESAGTDAWEQSGDTIVIKYAKGLSVSYEADGIHVSISNPEAGSRMKPVELVVREPKRRFVVTTALQLGNFEVLGIEDCVVGMNTMRSLHSEVMKEQLKDGRTVKIGREGVFDIEAVVAAEPDFILVSTTKFGGFDVLRDLGIPIIPHHGYKESHPLGHAEWIKLIGLLTGEEAKANEVFDNIERQYNELKGLVDASVTERPTITSGRVIRDGWYATGGRSYLAQMFSDAGATYLMSNNDNTGGVTLDFEAAYALSAEADYWQMVSREDGEFSLDILRAEDPRYAQLKAFKEGHVIHCNFKTTPHRELAGVEPHIVLADLVKAIHPEILPDYTPKYYKLIHN